VQPVAARPLALHKNSLRSAAGAEESRENRNMKSYHENNMLHNETE
jgi:hypothetical protein